MNSGYSGWWALYRQCRVSLRDASQHESILDDFRSLNYRRECCHCPLFIQGNEHLKFLESVWICWEMLLMYANVWSSGSGFRQLSWTLQRPYLMEWTPKSWRKKGWHVSIIVSSWNVGRWNPNLWAASWRIREIQTIDAEFRSSTWTCWRAESCLCHRSIRIFGVTMLRYLTVLKILAKKSIPRICIYIITYHHIWLHINPK